MVKESNVVNNLNNGGIFLQKYCAKKINEAGWKVEEEFPVTVKFQAGKTNEVYESTGDVRARLTPENLDCELVALVECKHRFNARWIFFEPVIPSSTTLKLLDLQYLVETDLSRKASKDKIGFYYYAELDSKKIENCLVSNNGKEIPDTTSHGKKKYESVYLACREVALATKSSAEEFCNDFEYYGVSLPDIAPTHTILIPVIVTSASLDFCNYSLRDFEKEKVVKNPSFTRVDWLVYNFPLPSELRIPYKMQHFLDYNEMSRQTVFIVDFTKCKEFFELLERYFKSYSKDILHETEYS